MSAPTPRPQRERFLRSLRARELRAIKSQLGTQRNILEIGGGTGWQARLMERMGHHVSSIDTKHPAGREILFPVALYDGRLIPMDDASVDVVFSSNVLEHIPHVDAFEQEMRRVLTPEGRAIHVLPTTSWRLWTSITHPWLVLTALRRFFSWGHNASGDLRDDSAMSYKWQYVIWPNRHGEKGNSLSEIYWFSQHAWTHHFRSSGWNVERVITTGLFYTGNSVMHRHLPFSCRRALARWLGSSTKAYVLRRA